MLRLTPISQGRSIEFFLGRDNQLNSENIDQFDLFDLRLVGTSENLSHYNSFKIFDPTQIYLGLNTKSERWKSKKDRCNFFSKLRPQHVITQYGELGKLPVDFLPSGILGYSAQSTFKSPYLAANNSQLPKPNHNFCLSYLTLSVPKQYRAAYFEMIKELYPKAVPLEISVSKHFGKSFLDSKCDALIVGLKSNYLDAYEYLEMFS